MQLNLLKPYIVVYIFLGLAIFRILISDLIPVNWDGPIFIDGSYRVYLGQIPNKDFSAPLGPLIFLSGGFGMWISTPSILGMNLGLILFVSIIAAIFIFLFWPDLKKKTELIDLIFFLVIFLLLFSPKILGGKPFSLAYTGYYNNISYAILTGVTYFLYASNYCQDAKRNFLLGLLVGILLYVKLVFFLASVLICYFFIIKYRKNQIINFSLGLLTSIFILVLMQDGINFFLKDQMLVSYLRMKENPYFSLERLWNFFKHTWIDILIFITILIVSLKKPKKFFVIGVLLFIFEYFLSMAIMQKPVHITGIIFALVMIKYSESNVQEKIWNQFKCNFLHIFLIGKFLLNSMLWIPFLLINFSFPTFNVENSKLILKHSISKHIHNWDFVKYIADCETECKEILIVGQNNIFNFYLDLNPAKGRLLYWQKGVTFSKELIDSENFFSKDLILKDVSRIILAKGFHHESSKEFIEIYGKNLRENFSLKIENDEVSVYQIKN